jgi:hypothetical protein
MCTTYPSQHLKAYYNIIEDCKKYSNTVLQNLAISEFVRAEVEGESRLQIIIHMDLVSCSKRPATIDFERAPVK